MKEYTYLLLLDRSDINVVVQQLLKGHLHLNYFHFKLGQMHFPRRTCYVSSYSADIFQHCTLISA